VRRLSLFLACQHLNSWTNLRECEDFVVHVVPVFRFDWCQVFSRTSEVLRCIRVPLGYAYPKLKTTTCLVFGMNYTCHLIRFNSAETSNCGFLWFSSLVSHKGGTFSLWKNTVAWVSERTIPTELPPLVGEVSANFWGQRGVEWSARRIPTAVISDF
jgi:hypothetical protein